MMWMVDVDATAQHIHALSFACNSQYLKFTTGLITAFRLFFQVTSSKPSAVSRRSGKSFTSLYVWRKTSRVQRAAPSVLGLVKNGPAFQRR